MGKDIYFIGNGNMLHAKSALNCGLTTMTMALNGLAKLTEELGELQQVVGKMMAYGTGSHPDGTESLLTRFEEESADVVAALEFVWETHGVNREEVDRRSAIKLGRFLAWHADPEV